MNILEKNHSHESDLIKTIRWKIRSVKKVFFYHVTEYVVNIGK